MKKTIGLQSPGWLARDRPRSHHGRSTITAGRRSPPIGSGPAVIGVRRGGETTAAAADRTTVL
ncbi:hypothetical protein ACFO5R_16990 [Halosolutus amylolyticus]|uniref:Uncharacterized protein n=1 Tax=Halosolutus amylolyticus TaxID=2932267 RepID=A0ABD5PTJ0_9EURY|nr:hypothetical protein [Halosolutus amylolyticus]